MCAASRPDEEESGAAPTSSPAFDPDRNLAPPPPRDWFRPTPGGENLAPVPDFSDNIAPVPDLSDNLAPPPPRDWFRPTPGGENLAPVPDFSDNIAPVPDFSDNIAPVPDLSDNLAPPPPRDWFRPTPGGENLAPVPGLEINLAPGPPEEWGDKVVGDSWRVGERRDQVGRTPTETPAPAPSAPAGPLPGYPLVHYGPFSSTLGAPKGSPSVTVTAEAWTASAWRMGRLDLAKVDTKTIRAWYKHVILRVDVTCDATTYTTYARVTAPLDKEDTSALYTGFAGDPAMVLFMAGTTGVGVDGPDETLGGLREPISTDDEMAAVLAMGAVPLLFGFSAGGWAGSFGREGEPVFTVVFNRPSLGGHGYRADPIPEYQDWGPGNLGDDDGGPYTSMFLEAVATCALACIEDLLGDAGVQRPPRLFLVSFSNGLAAASRWLRYTSTTVRAYVDAEGPTDSLEQTVTTTCYDPFKIANALGASLPANVDLPAWMDAYNAGVRLQIALRSAGYPSGSYGGGFPNAFGYMFRPPLEVLAEMEATLPWAGPMDLPFPARIASLADRMAFFRQYRSDRANFFDHIREYWEDREAYTHLQYLPCPYVRANGFYDHVQSYHYQNRHAARALDAASSSPIGADVYLADETYWTAVGRGSTPEPTWLSDFESTHGSMDVDDHTTFPTWPEFSASTGARAHVEVDLVRWAVAKYP